MRERGSGVRPERWVLLGSGWGRRMTGDRLGGLGGGGVVRYGPAKDSGPAHHERLDVVGIGAARKARSPFDKLRAGSSTSSGQALRQAQGRISGDLGMPMGGDLGMTVIG